MRLKTLDECLLLAHFELLTNPTITSYVCDSFGTWPRDRFGNMPPGVRVRLRATVPDLIATWGNTFDGLTVT